jgi:predicted TIM-barrel fold metal-dependent hydrolase
MEPAYRDRLPQAFACWDRCDPVGSLGETVCFHQEAHVNGYDMPAFDPGFRDGFGVFPPTPGASEVYEEYVQRGFNRDTYQLVLDRSGIDYMVLYPTAGLTMNCVNDLDPGLAAAQCHAYNSWLSDFLAGSDGRLVGAGTVDLRDPARAVAEAQRCVGELGFKAVQINPEPTKDYPAIWDTRYDPLWATMEELGVPLGLHLAPITPLNVGRYYFGSWAPGIGTSAFIVGNMMASVALIVGGVLERHPNLRVVHLETGCGWVPFWLERMESGTLGIQKGLKERGLSPLKMRPKEYFLRQCYVSADQDDEWIPEFVRMLGDKNVVTATDFGHPEGKGYVHAIQDTASLDGISEESKRRIMWDNAATLYDLSELSDVRSLS